MSPRWIRVQALSGLLFAFFLSLHLATTISAAGGTSLYDRVLDGLRAVYRPHILVEAALIFIPAGVHVVCAVAMILSRRRQGPAPRPPATVRFHRWSGYVLLAAIGGHVFATRAMLALSTAPTSTGSADFAYLAYSLLNWPVFMIPYYFVLGLAGAVHLTLGIRLAAERLGPRLPAFVPKMAAVLALVLGIAVVAGVSGLVAGARKSDRSRFPEYQGLYQRFTPFMKPGLAGP